MKNTANKPPIVRLQDVSKCFVKSLDFAGKIAQKLGVNIREEMVHAVDNVSLSIAQGEVVGLAGESGCGKSTLGRMVAGILPLSEGTIFYKGKDVAQLPPVEFKQFALNIQMIFQDPFASLNPRKRVSDIIGDAPLVHGIARRLELDVYLDKVMLRCGLDPVFKRRYPHQFSGGQRQRIGIARALAVNPEFIGPDLGVVEHISDRIVIMYLGRVVETAKTDELFSAPNHPYTRALLHEIPRLENRCCEFATIKGEIPSPLDPPSGCHFNPRCPHAMNRCREEVPVLKEIAPHRFSACHLNEIT